jgi:regulator of sirC expression with transglutaminase-like and TPR domain
LVAIGLTEDTDIRLDRAALDLAAADRTRAPLEPALIYLDSLAGRLQPRARSGLAADRADALTALLADAEGFTGDSSNYEAPENADFLRVIEHRRGLPIALAILYVGVARRVGWRAEVLGVPGHVLVAVAGAGTTIVLDPFSDGRMLSADGVRTIAARALGRHGAMDRDHVAPLSNREALVRLLMNPASRAARRGDEARALTLYRRMTLVAPAMPALWWERARLERLAGDTVAARGSLAAMLETTRDPVLVSRIQAAVDALTR